MDAFCLFFFCLVCVWMISVCLVRPTIYVFLSRMSKFLVNRDTGLIPGATQATPPYYTTRR